MANKNGPQKRHTTRRQRPAPSGLRAVVGALMPDGYNANFPVSTADRVHETARALVQARRPQDGYHDAVFVTADRLFDGTDDPARTQPTMIADAGFWLGVATCWYLLAAINGTDGTR